MSDPLTWSINLGRWSGTQIRVHLFLVLFVVGRLLESALTSEPKGHPVAETIAWLSLLVVAILLHELGHAAMAVRLGFEIDEIRLWPLGNLVGPSTSTLWRTPEAVLVSVAGPITSAMMALVAAIGLGFAESQMIFNPFGGPAGGAPILSNGQTAAPLSAVWWVGWFGYLNWVLFLANLIPALPMDMGRTLRGILASQSKDGMIAPHTARVCAVLLALVGLFRLYGARPGAFALIALAILIEWMVRIEARMLEEGGFFDDGVFGYDFSQGYTSLESGAPAVRPKKESALKRWRRRRSELRRQRREAKEAAEEQRMDEILDKLHRGGRSSLSEEEHQFLVRVSAKYRSKRMQGS